MSKKQQVRPGALRRLAYRYIQRPLTEWLGGSFTPSTLEEFLDYTNTSVSKAGQTVNSDSALQLSTVWACARLIGETLGTLPFELYSRTGVVRERATDHSLYPVLKLQPNQESTAATFWESMAAAAMLRGNAFARKMRGTQGQIVGLEFFPPGRFSWQWNQGRYRYWYTMQNSRRVEIPESEIFHVPGFTTTGRFGLSVIRYGASVFGGAQAAQTSANKFWENGLTLTTAYEFPGTFKDKTQRDAARDYIKEVHGAINSGEPVLLENGMSANQVGVNPKDAQLLESRTFGVEEICRWFRVDPSLVGHGGKDSNFGTGLETKMLGFLMLSLRPWLVKFEQNVNLQLLTPVERLHYYAEYNIEGLLRADSKTRSDVLTTMIEKSVYTPDEVRVMENKAPMGGNAGKLLANGAMLPLDDLGQVAPGIQSEPRNEQLFKALERKSGENLQ